MCNCVQALVSILILVGASWISNLIFFTALYWKK